MDIYESQVSREGCVNSDLSVVESSNPESATTESLAVRTGLVMRLDLWENCAFLSPTPDLRAKTGRVVFRVDGKPHRSCPDYFVSEDVLAMSSNALRLFLRDLGTFLACLCQAYGNRLFPAGHFATFTSF